MKKLLLLALFSSCIYNTANVKFIDPISCVNEDGKIFCGIKEIDFLSFNGVDFITQRNDTIFIEMDSGNNYFLAHSEFLKALNDTTRFKIVF